MSKGWLRRATQSDLEAVIALNDIAFGGPEEGQIVRRLHTDNDSLRSFVVDDGQRLIGHIEFFRIRVDGAPVAAGLGPMCVHPDRQREEIGSAMVRLGMATMRGWGEAPFFVLGHRDFYPRFGFSAEAARAFDAPWSGPAFMAAHVEDGPVSSGTLTYPAAFGSQ